MPSGKITIGVSIEYVDVLMQTAKIERIKARIAAMQASNKAREQRGDCVVYENEFNYCENELEDISKNLDEMMKDMKAKAEQEHKAGEADPIEGPLAMTKDGVYPEAALEEGLGGQRV